MNTKILAIATVAAMAMLCIAPVLAEESDAEQLSYRMANRYLLMGSYTFENDVNLQYSSNSIFPCIIGSESDLNMQRYISDPLNTDVTTGDFQQFTHIIAGTQIHVYYTGDHIGDYCYFQGEPVYGTVVLEPYGNERQVYFVKAGDTLNVTADVRNHEGDAVTPQLILSSGSTVYMDDGHYTNTFDGSVSFYLYTGTGAVYYDVTMNVDGASSPNGSPVVYFAICAAVTLLVLAVLILAALKPKWSK